MGVTKNNRGRGITHRAIKVRYRGEFETRLNISFIKCDDSDGIYSGQDILKVKAIPSIASSRSLVSTFIMLVYALLSYSIEKSQNQYCLFDFLVLFF